MTSTLLRYAGVGLVNTAVGYGVIVVLQAMFGVPPLAANACGYGAGFVLSYLLNRSVTFRSRRSHRSGVPAFAAAAAACWLLNVAMLQIGLSWLALPPALAQALAVCSYTAAFYLASRHLVFGDHAA